jgi:hypothetical protein
MNLKVKSSLIVLVTFILGLVVGSIFTRSFFSPPKMMDRILAGRSPEGFAERFEKIIDPDESQKEKIREVLNLHFERMHGQSLEFRNHFGELRDSLRADLEPILTDEQIKRFDEMEEKFREHGRQGFGPRSPHPKRKFLREGDRQ